MPYTASETVVTQSCSTESTGTGEVALPRFDGQEQQSDLLNQLALQLESMVNDRLVAEAPCEICPDDGAIIIDCNKCTEFNVGVTTDINSITMLNCNDGGGNINFRVPTGVTRCICGWPERFGFEGGECFTECVGGGSSAAGRTFTVPFIGTSMGPKYAAPSGGGVRTGGGGGGGGAGGGGCACTPATVGQLTLVCCGSCAMDCTASSPSVKLQACGGVPPYSFSSTKGRVSTSGSAMTLTPTNNTGSAVAGTAYRLFDRHTCSPTPCTDACTGGANYKKVGYGCDDIIEEACADVSWSSPCLEGPCNNLTGGTSACPDGALGSTCKTYKCAPGGANEVFFVCPGGASCNGPNMCDTRTTQMVTDGCEPCGLMSGEVVTVTDSTGISVTKTITVTVA